MRLSYEQLEAVFDAAPVLICSVDRDYRYRMCNRGYASRFNLTPDQLVGRTVPEVLGASAWADIRTELDAALAGQTREFERDLTYQTGDRRRVRIVYKPERNNAGGVEGILAFVTDITDRAHAEAELRESEARFRNMADHSPMMLRVTNAAGHCTHLNERWYEFTGQNTATGFGTRWLDAIHADDLPSYTQIAEAAKAVHKNYQSEYRLRRRDGAFRWALEAASPRFSGRGEFLGYIGSVVDIQERKEVDEALKKTRQRFDIVKDAAQVGFWFCDLPFDELIWDQRVKEHFWLPPDARVTIDTFYEQIHPDDRERTRAAIAASIQERTRYDIEYRTVERTTRAERWVRVIGHTFYDDEGRPIRFDGVSLDVTERRRSEDALREAKEQAEQASRAKDAFLAQLSHELRTPLAPVLMMATALSEDDQLPADTREHLKMIARNVDLEARLIDDLLDLTRITHGKLILRAEPCDAHALLGLVAEIVKEEIRSKEIELTLQLRAKRSHLTGDPARLQQVLWNLLRNAVKFTHRRGHVLIRSFDCEESAAPGDVRLGLEIVDDGIGFDPALGERLFLPFERGNAAEDHRFPGLGLGLAIARSIVNLHGGKISASSAGAGRGATFTVELPGAYPNPDRQLGPIDRFKTEQIDASPIRLLLVEDHANTREVLTHLLRLHGHQVTMASSVEEALAAAGKEKFDVVMSDLGLPDGSGIQLMEQLRSRHGLTGIAVSGYGTTEDRRRTSEAGFVAHLVKPVNLIEVRRVLTQFAPTAK